MNVDTEVRGPWVIFIVNILPLTVQIVHSILNPQAICGGILKKCFLVGRGATHLLKPYPGTDCVRVLNLPATDIYHANANGKIKHSRGPYPEPMHFIWAFTFLPFHPSSLLQSLAKSTISLKQHLIVLTLIVRISCKTVSYITEWNTTPTVNKVVTHSFWRLWLTRESTVCL